MTSQRTDLYSQVRSVVGSSYPEIFAKFRELSERYGNMDRTTLINAFNSVTGGMMGFENMYTPNPYVQNRRYKGIVTRPHDYSKEEVSGFTKKPDMSERELRAVEKGLEYTSYPMLHIRTVYQNLLTYHSYVAPSLETPEDVKKDDFWREWRLLEKLRKTLNPKDTGHELCGSALQSGKVFVTPRISVDKTHNAVNYAFLQQLPSDWVKIVGCNNVSKYTVAFNLMYFCEPGTDWRQYEELLRPYFSDFVESVYPPPQIRGNDKKVIFAKGTGINLQRVAQAGNSNVEAVNQNGRWFYWVTLPVDKCFPFEVDDTERNVIPPFVGMFVELIQLSQMEDIALQILQNPLVACLVGEIPYWDNQSNNEADQYKLSDAGRRMFESFWYQMLGASGSTGIGFYSAPLENMKLESLNEAPHATEIVSNAIEDLGAKSGLSAIIPSSAEARAGAVQVSLAIESRMPQTIYRCYERMMKSVIRNLNLKYDWQFSMFGSLSEDPELAKSLREEMTLGILPAAIEFNALKDRSILDDISWSNAIDYSGLLDLRKPLISSYNASNKDGNLPPQSGRPKSEGITSDGQEQDLDSTATQGVN